MECLDPVNHWLSFLAPLARSRHRRGRALGSHRARCAAVPSRGDVPMGMASQLAGGAECGAGSGPGAQMERTGEGLRFFHLKRCPEKGVWWGEI